MPPGPGFNWLCVASSACDILVRVARIKASQITSEGALGNSARSASAAKNRYNAVPAAPATREGIEWRRELTVESPSPDEPPVASSPPDVLPTLETVTSSVVEPLLKVGQRPNKIQTHPVRSYSPAVAIKSIPAVADAQDQSTVQEAQTQDEPPPIDPHTSSSEAPLSGGIPSPVVLELGRLALPSEHVEDSTVHIRQLQSSKVPSSRIGRLFHYGGLAASLGYGAASEIIRRTASSGSDGSQQSVMMTEANITRLVSKLSQMRGAALKLGQFLSIQDTHVLPADVHKIFRRVQDSAHYMPDWQMAQVLSSALGPDWERFFTSFDRVPFAAASIGQVHTATLAAAHSPTGAPARVAVKIQFPNIDKSIASDLGYISMFLTAGRLLPKGLFLERTMQVMKEELKDECDYTREADHLRTFGALDHLGGDPRFAVPWVWDGSTARVLVMEHLEGMSVDVAQLDQRDRDEISARIIELCLKELFEFRLMQTDPNWSNFLWNASTRRVELVDFGATRHYSKAFIDNWLRLLQAAALDDRAACIDRSLKLGYLTGEENQMMLDAHIDSITLLATPFKPGTPQPFAFGQGSRWADVTAQIRAQIPIMVQHRLTPPPRETYSLNRKLSGAFLLAARLDATVDARAIWDRVVSKYEFST
ncbi:ABC1-domain-containing protein [Mycena belliarum]|uniref:ABC1-domain-containing protein n=1 Tax=Mycena belliarum TaxID=1033014 RepID=A0AAD6U286_9AGAR|nr:ABC1-domain-containing protein [Mycena belliae]